MLRKPVEDVHYQNKGINQLERNNWEFWVPIFWLLLGWESRSLSSVLECGTFNNDYVDDIGEGNGNPLQYSCLENPMDGGAWLASDHGFAESDMTEWLFTFTFHFHALEKEMATYSSILAWRTPGTREPRGLPFMSISRVGHNWVTSLSWE